MRLVTSQFEDAQTPFDGAKIALFDERQILVYTRDQTPGLLFPGFLDLPGGGREKGETPYECIRREVLEEFGIFVPAERILWCRIYDGFRQNMLPTYFMVAKIEHADIQQIHFGAEGQSWSMMDPTVFIGHANGVPHLQRRLADYLQAHLPNLE